MLFRSQFALSSGPPRLVETREGYRLSDSNAEPEGLAPASDRRAGETRGAKIATAVIALVIGAVLGIVLTINHQQTWTIAGVTIPVGVIAGLAIITAMLVGFRLIFDTRTVALCAAIGVNVTIAVFSQKSPGGSVLVPANVEGFVWAYAPLLIAVIVVAWPKLPLRHRDKIEALHPTQEGPSQ